MHSAALLGRHLWLTAGAGTLQDEKLKLKDADQILIHIKFAHGSTTGGRV
jgi:hypothetical protein